MCRELFRIRKNVLSIVAFKSLPMQHIFSLKIVNSNIRHIQAWQPVGKPVKNCWTNVRLQRNLQPATKCELLITERETRSITSIIIFSWDCLISEWKNFHGWKHYYVDELASVWWMTSQMHKVFLAQVEVLTVHR